MTVIMLCRSADGDVHLFSDGAMMVRESNALGHIAKKIFVADNKAFTWLLSGSGEFQRWLAFELNSRRFAGIDEVRQNLAQLLRDMADHVKDFSEQELSAQDKRQILTNCVVFAGFSQKQQRVVSFLAGHSGPGEVDDMPAEIMDGWEPFQKPYFSFCDDLDPATLETDAPFNATAEELRAWSIRAMESMRPSHFGKGAPQIGGHVQHVAVSKTAITDEIIHTWPDLPGKELKPVLSAPIALGVKDAAPSMGFSLGFKCRLGGAGPRLTS